MNTNDTRHSDGASEIAQEHRGTTNHPKQTEAVRTMDTSSTIMDTTGPGASSRERRSPRLLVRSRPRVRPAHPLPAMWHGTRRRFDSMRPPLAA